MTICLLYVLPHFRVDMTFSSLLHITSEISYTIHEFSYLVFFPKLESEEVRVSAYLDQIPVEPGI